MKLATTTGDFPSYTNSQTAALSHIRKAGFRYADYAFGWDYRNGTGVFADDFQRYLDEVRQHAEALGLRLIQAHAPMGRPLDDGGALLELRDAFERYLYELGKCVLEKYGCFEE